MEIRPYEHWFSKYEDEDFYDDLEERRHKVKHAPVGGAIMGGLLGGGLGYSLSRKNPGLSAAIGAAGLGAVGYVSGRHHKRRENKEADRLERRYREGSRTDKQYLRRRLQDIERKKLEERKARAQEAIAWNTIWH